MCYFVLICKKYRSKLFWIICQYFFDKWYITCSPKTWCDELSISLPSQFLYSIQTPRQCVKRKILHVSELKGHGLPYIDRRVTVQILVHRGSSLRDGDPSFSLNTQPNTTYKYFSLLINKLECNNYRGIVLTLCIPCSYV